METSLPLGGLESSLNVDMSGGQANASPATVVSSGAEVEGRGQNSSAGSVRAIQSHSEGDASGSIAVISSYPEADASGPFTASVAPDDHARAHDFVLQSHGVRSSGIESSCAAGGLAHGRDRLHPAKRASSVERFWMRPWSR